MVDRSSFHQVSQTQLEQGELIQYECNLAACYEAEYLLSLKIQEEMCHHRNLYNDPSEVMVASAVDTAVTIDDHHNLYLTQENTMDCSAAVDDARFYSFVSQSETGQQLQGSTASSSCIGDMNTEVSSGGKETGIEEEQRTHPDGPHRKKLCLNRAEY